MLEGPALDAAIRKLGSRPLRDTFFRAIPLRFASDPLGKKRPINAQRFNVRGGARVLYLAEDQIVEGALSGLGSVVAVNVRGGVSDGLP